MMLGKLGVLRGSCGSTAGRGSWSLVTSSMAIRCFGNMPSSPPEGPPPGADEFRGVFAGMDNEGAMSESEKIEREMRSNPAYQGLDFDRDNRRPALDNMTRSESDMKLSATPDRISDREYYIKLLANENSKMPKELQDYYIRSYDMAPDVVAQTITLFRKEVGDSRVEDLPRHMLSRLLTQIFENVASDVALEAQKQKAEQEDEQQFIKEGKSSGFGFWYEEPSLTNPELPNFVKEEIFADLKNSRPPQLQGAAARRVADKDWVYGCHPSEASEEQIDAVLQEVKMQIKEGREDPEERALMEKMKKETFKTSAEEKEWSNFPHVKVS